ncbi:MAG: hypothetical protein PHT23_03415, partial [Bacteroidales bacterium]|nr:hypothetical protein [Bacteroidales bacterium]
MKTKNTDKLFDRWINNPNDQFSFDELNELLQNIDKDSESKHIDDFFAENWEKAGQEKEGNEFNQDCNYQAISQFIRQK